MIGFQEPDEAVSIRDQLREDTAEPVVLINILHVAPNGAGALLAGWAADGRCLKEQAGFIPAQLHRGTAGSGTFLNHAAWENVGAFRAAFENPAFRSKLAAYPDGSTASPRLFGKVAVSGAGVA